MKRLLLVRHAKSDWSDGSLDDFDRPLNRRGRADAPEMAALLLRRDLRPVFLLSSPANRAYSTARLFAEGFGIPENDISTDESLYEANTHTLVAAARALPDGYDAAAIFSHNPALTAAVARFTTDYINNVPTCGVAVIESDVSKWADFTPDTARLRALLIPKEVLKRYD